MPEIELGKRPVCLARIRFIFKVPEKFSTEVCGSHCLSVSIIECVCQRCVCMGVVAVSFDQDSAANLQILTKVYVRLLLLLLLLLAER